MTSTNTGQTGQTTLPSTVGSTVTVTGMIHVAANVQSLLNPIGRWVSLAWIQNDLAQHYWWLTIKKNRENSKTTNSKHFFYSYLWNLLVHHDTWQHAPLTLGCLGHCLNLFHCHWSHNDNNWQGFDLEMRPIWLSRIVVPSFIRAIKSLLLLDSIDDGIL